MEGYMKKKGAREQRKSKNGDSTSLGRSHEIAVGEEDGDGVLLDGSGLVVFGKRNVGHERAMQVGLFERRNWCRRITTFYFYGNLVVLVEVDASVGAGEENSFVRQITRNKASSATPRFKRGFGFG